MISLIIIAVVPILLCFGIALVASVFDRDITYGIYHDIISYAGRFTLLWLAVDIFVVCGFMIRILLYGYEFSW